MADSDSSAEKLDDHEQFHENVKALEANKAWPLSIPQITSRHDLLNPELQVQYPDDSY